MLLNALCLNKNVPTLASYSFDKHRLFFYKFWQTVSAHFQKNVHFQLSLSLQFYLLYLFLNSSDGNDAMLMSLSVCK